VVTGGRVRPPVPLWSPAKNTKIIGIKHSNKKTMNDLKNQTKYMTFNQVLLTILLFRSIEILLNNIYMRIF